MKGGIFLTNLYVNFNINEYTIKFVYTKYEAKKTLVSRWFAYYKGLVIANMSFEQFEQADASYIQEDDWKDLYNVILGIDKDDISCDSTLIIISNFNNYANHIRKFTLQHIDFSNKEIMLNSNE